MRILIFLIVLHMTVVISAIGCLEDPTVLHQKDSDGDGFWDSAELELGTDPNNADTDGDGMNDYAEVARGRNPLGPDESDEPVVGHLQPYGKSIYSVGPTMGAYGEDGLAMYTWTFSDPNGLKPSERKFACVTPTELPDEFWDKYDTREALMKQDWIDKKADNLYIPFDEDGMISFSINTYRIPGKYGFKVCGILDENYTDEISYAGDGDEISVEVAERGLVVVDKKCILLDSTKYSKSFGCYWEMEYANGSDFRCGHLMPPQPYEPLIAADGTEKNALFTITKKEGTSEKHTFLMISSKRGSTINRGDTYTMCDTYQSCGCCKNHNFKHYAKDINGMCANTGLREGDSETWSIGVNQKHFTYEGDGDPITITFSS